MPILLERIRSLSSHMSPHPTGETARLNALEGIRCVAFDFYGTLFISGVGDIGIDEETQSEGLQWFSEALADTGYEAGKEAAERGLQLFEESIGNYVDQHRSEKIDFPEPDIVLIWLDVLNRLEQEGAIHGPVDHEAARRFAVEYEFRFNAVWPMPGIGPVLALLRDRNYLLGIISNSQFYTPLAFEALSGSDLKSSGFDPDLLVWSYEAGVKKPSTSFYRKFVETLHRKHRVHAGEVLFVGNDMLKDIMPASELGMKTALFAGDKRSLKLREGDARCIGIEPDLVITELSQLAGCL